MVTKLNRKSLRAPQGANQAGIGKSQDVVALPVTVLYVNTETDRDRQREKERERDRDRQTLSWCGAKNNAEEGSI